MTKGMIGYVLVGLIASATAAGCSTVRAAPDRMFQNEAEFYAALEPSNQPIVSSIRAIESRKENAEPMQAMRRELSSCDTWIMMRREALQPLTYTLTSLCLGRDDSVRIESFESRSGGRFIGTISYDAASLVTKLKRSTIVADSGLAISDGSFTFITLYANGKLYRHAIVCDDCVETSDQDENFALIASAAKKVRELVAQAKKE